MLPDRVVVFLLSVGWAVGVSLVWLLPHTWWWAFGLAAVLIGCWGAGERKRL